MRILCTVCLAGCLSARLPAGSCLALIQDCGRCHHWNKNGTPINLDREMQHDVALRPTLAEAERDRIAGLVLVGVGGPSLEVGTLTGALLIAKNPVGGGVGLGVGALGLGLLATGGALLGNYDRLHNRAIEQYAAEGCPD
jgi:hypothetical protein